MERPKGTQNHGTSRRAGEYTRKREAACTKFGVSVAIIFQSYGLTAEESKPVVDALRKLPQAWVDFMMLFELGLEKPDLKRGHISAGTIAGAYIAGGFIPLGPYLILPTAKMALTVSVITTLITLAIFGYVKGHFAGAPPLRSGSQTVLIGGLAAAAAFMIARAISCEPSQEKLAWHLYCGRISSSSVTLLLTRDGVTVLQPILFVLLTGWLRLWDTGKHLLSLPRSAI